ncbi:MAG TPA: hypothetical protein VM733_05245 [Thermoanaerobaculia bacterium]|nr:hypothetical protein [Thermoanaerobaculia bacterium]
MRLTRSLIARYGAQGVVIVDLNEGGARIEHFAPLHPGRTSTLTFDWNSERINVEAQVVTSRVHRFSDGQHGGTVYQSGLAFGALDEKVLTGLHELMTTMISRSVAEQVANLRGLGPVVEREMPVFQEGVVATDAVERSETKRIPIKRAHQGYTRCTLVPAGRRWQRRWTTNPQQPEGDGFTVLATEPRELVDMLCEDYIRCDTATRKLIRLLARVTVEDSLTG